MLRFSLFVAAGILSITSSAYASSFIGTSDSIGASLVNTVDASSDATSSIGDDKVVLDARDDAASFVGSEGSIRGAHLEAALTHIRHTLPNLEATDMQLAEAILAR